MPSCRAARGRWRSVVLGICTLTVACGGSTANRSGAGGLRGPVVADGSSTVAPITEAIAEEFRNEQPGVQPSVGTSGTGGGFKRFCADEIDIANASRAIREEEKATCAAAGVQYEELRIGLDGLAVVTSAKNRFLRCLTFDQLATIFRAGGARTWNEVDPAFPGEKVAIFAPGSDSGTYDFFVETVLGDQRQPDSVRPRSDYTASEDDNTVVQGIQGETHSWGFFGYAYFNENQAKLKAIEVSKGDACVAPSARTVESGAYPLSRSLFIYVKRSALARPEVRRFVRFYLETAPELVESVGYTPAPAGDYQAGLDRLRAAG